MEQLTIGRLADKTGVTADTLRYYEKMKLIQSGSRTLAGYRLYMPETVSVIRFIKTAQALNFTLKEIRELLTLKRSDKATCAQIIDKTEKKIADAETRICELKDIRNILLKLVDQCPGGDNSLQNCPILDHIQGK